MRWPQFGQAVPDVMRPVSPISPELTAGGMWHALRSRWLWILVPTAVAFVGSFLAVNSITPRYTAEARILLESRDSFYTRPAAEQSEPASSQFDAEAVQSQVQVALSRDLAIQAIRELGLVGNPEFDPLIGGVGTVRKVMVLAGLAKNPVDKNPEQRVLEAYYDKLTVYAAGKSRVLVVEFQSRDPELAARAANTVAKLYLSTQEAAKIETARSASAWLSNAIDELRVKVTQSEARVESFRSEAGLLSAGVNTTLTTQQLSELSGQLAAARNAQAESQAKAKLIREMLRTGRAFEIPDVANNELIRRLIEQRINLRAQLALEMRTLLSEHPRIKELSAQLADLESQIRAAGERTVRALENDARIAGSRVESLLAAIDEQKKQVSTANENEVTLRALEREARTHREQLESYLVKYREATARDVENAMPADGRIVSQAITPLAPSFPKKLPIVMIVTLAVFIAMSGGILAKYMLTVGIAADDHPAEWQRGALAPGSLPNASVMAGQPYARPQPATNAVPAHRIEAVVAATAPAPAMSAVPMIRTQGTTFDPATGAQLGALLQSVPIAGRGRRIMLVQRAGRDMQAVLVQLVSCLGGQSSLVYVQTPPAHEDPFAGDDGDDLGLTDLVAGDASFAEVIMRPAGQRWHRIGAGTGPAIELADDVQSVEVALTALEQAYDWVVCGIPADSMAVLAPVFVSRVDNIVILNDERDGDPSLAIQRAGLGHLPHGKVVAVSVAPATAQSIYAA